MIGSSRPLLFVEPAWATFSRCHQFIVANSDTRKIKCQSIASQQATTCHDLVKYLIAISQIAGIHGACKEKRASLLVGEKLPGRIEKKRSPSPVISRFLLEPVDIIRYYFLLVPTKK